MQDKLIEAVAQAIWTANTYPAKGEQPDESSMNDYRRMAESAIAAVRAHDAESAPEQPVEDVVSRMCKLMGGCACEHCIKRMTAALAVAREGYVKLEDVEKAILESRGVLYASDTHPERIQALADIKRLRARLAPKEPRLYKEGKRVFLDGKMIAEFVGPLAEARAEDYIAALVERIAARGREGE